MITSDEPFDLFDDLSQSSVLLDEARIGTRQDIIEDGFCFLLFLLDLLGTHELRLVFRLRNYPVDIGQLVARLLPGLVFRLGGIAPTTTNCPSYYIHETF